MAAHSCALLILPMDLDAAYPSWLKWEAPSECPDAGFIEQRVQEGLGRKLPEEIALQVATRLSFAEGQWKVIADLSYEGQVGQRQVAVGTCQEAAEFVAVAVVLAVSHADASDSHSASSEARPEALPEIEALPQESAQKEPKVVTYATLKPSDATPKSSLRGFAGIVGVAVGGPLPTVQAGVGLEGGLKMDRFHLALEAAWLPPIEHSFVQARAPLQFSLVYGRISLAYLWDNQWGKVGPSASANAGGIYVAQRTQDGPRRLDPWIALGAGLQGHLLFSVSGHLWAEAEVEVPLFAPLFVLDDGAPVHQVTVGGRGALGLRYFF